MYIYIYMYVCIYTCISYMHSFFLVCQHPTLGDPFVATFAAEPSSKTIRVWSPKGSSGE